MTNEFPSLASLTSSISEDSRSQYKAWYPTRGSSEEPPKVAKFQTQQ